MGIKFQNRLVGSVVLLLLGIIVLPRMFNEKTKYYQDEGAILLVPNPDNLDEPNIFPDTTQKFPTKLIEKEEKKVPTANMASELKLVEKSNLAIPNLNLMKQNTSKELLSSMKTTVETQNQESNFLSTSKVYAIQLGALKNAVKVNEVVRKLHEAGYRAYTAPSMPVQGKITRILIGPEISKDKLKASLTELKKLSRLKGVVVKCSGYR